MKRTVPVRHLVPLFLVVALSGCVRSADVSTAAFPGRPELFDPTPETIAELRGSDPAWPYVLARSVRSLDMRATAIAILKDDVARGEEPWSRLSAELLFDMARERSEWLLLEETALLARTLVGMEEVAGRARAEALYRQERYDEVPDATGTITEDDESALWRAVAERELGRETWQWAFLDVFLAYPASDIHRRLYLYLFYRGDLSAFPGVEQRLLAASYRAAIGETGEARRLLRALPRPTVEDVSAGGDVSGFLDTAGRAFAAGSAADATAGIEWYGDRGDVPPEVLERAGRYDEAGRAYGVRGDASGMVRTALSAGASLSEALAAAGGVAAAQAGDRRIERLLSSELARLVRERNVAELMDVRGTLPREFSRLHARIELILHHFGEEVPLESARALPAGTYERFWAEHIEGRPISLVEGSDADRTGSSAGGEGGAQRFSDTSARLSEQLLNASLYDDAYRELRRAMGAGEIDPADVSRLARRFAEGGSHFESITLLRIALAESERGPRAAERSLLYPRLYPGEFAAASEEGGFPPSLLHGLVREESHYRVTAQSHADAQGLAQVLPGTAADMARRIGMDTYDIHGVSDNLRLGSAYLTFLFERLETPVEVLAGYNAGYRRAVDWTAQFGDLHPVLFVEAIPFAETRAYVRNVVRSALYYEETLSPADYLRLLFGLEGAQ